MRLTKLLPLIAFSGGMAIGTAVTAQSVVDASDVETIANIARGYGSATVQTDSGGDPQIVGRMDGVQYLVNFYGCTNGQGCTTIQFVSAWENPGSVTITDINRWNMEKRFGKAYLDQANDPVIAWDVNLFGGVSSRNLDDTFDWWRIVLENFAQDVL